MLQRYEGMKRYESMTDINLRALKGQQHVDPEIYKSCSKVEEMKGLVAICI